MTKRSQWYEKGKTDAGAEHLPLFKPVDEGVDSMTIESTIDNLKSYGWTYEKIAEYIAGYLEHQPAQFTHEVLRSRSEWVGVVSMLNKPRKVYRHAEKQFVWDAIKAFLTWENHAGKSLDVAVSILRAEFFTPYDTDQEITL